MCIFLCEKTKNGGKTWAYLNVQWQLLPLILIVGDRTLEIKFILLFTALIVFNTLKPVLQYGLDNGAVSTPLLLPLLFGSTEISIGTPKMYFHIGLILLLCDAPFYYPITPYAIMRSNALVGALVLVCT